ncbi:transglutaminase-like domain-containing protein [Actinomyces wuliandei]|uniref:transglutaminase-like domain-containing protein n=1 Tax=Actinomyces wuliandei TaxID=2057743 RepID=UPI000FDBAB7F|nr:transglutaminase-like domain-containing protein [Actinomyces wuliandei]
MSPLPALLRRLGPAHAPGLRAQEPASHETHVPGHLTGQPAPRSTTRKGEATRPARRLTPPAPPPPSSRRPLLDHRFQVLQKRPEPPGRATAVLEVVLTTALLAAGALPFLPVFGGTSGYLAALYGIGAGAATALGCSALRLTALPTTAALAVVHVVMAPWLLPDVGTGREAVLAVLAASVTVWRDSLSVPLPLGSFTAMTVLPWLTCLSVSGLATRLVLSGRDVLAGPVAMVTPLVAIAWGGQSQVAPRLLGPALAAGLLLLWSTASLRRRRLRVEEALSDDTGSGRPGSLTSAPAPVAMSRATRRGAALAVTTTVSALSLVLVVNPLTPAARTVLRDVLEPPLSLSEYATPLSLVRSIETDLADTELLALSGAPEGTRVRVAALDSYDGLAARVGESPVGGSRFERVGAQTSLSGSAATSYPAPTAPGRAQAVTLSVRGYSFPWVPTVSATERIEVSGPRRAELSESLYYDAFSATGILTAGLVEGDVLAETVRPYAPPSESQMSTDSLAQVSLGPVEQVPSSVVALAAEIVGSESDPLSQVRALQQRLRTSYYSDGSQSPSSPGHGAARIASMVEAESLVGDDEQYSVLMMLLCRSLGIPARVVMGFNPSTDGDATTVTGADISAWVEVPFESLGWVAVDVTPDRDQVPQQQTTQKVSNPEPQVLQPPLPEEDPADLPPSYEDPDNDGTEEDQGSGPLRAVLLAAGSILGLAAVLGAIVGWKVLRRLRRRRRTGVDSALGSWEELVDRARDLGRAPSWGATRREAAHELDPHFPQADLPTFANAVDTQVFGPDDPTSYALGELWSSCDAIIRAMSADRPRLRRLQARLSLRSLVHPAGRTPRRRPPRRYRS